MSQILVKGCQISQVMVGDLVGPDSRKLSDRIFERLLIYRVVQDTDMVLSAVFNPNLRCTPRLYRLQLGQYVIPIGDYLDIEPLPRFGQAQGHALFVACHDCHGGNLPLVWLDFKRLLSRAPAHKD